MYVQRRGANCRYVFNALKSSTSFAVLSEHSCCNNGSDCRGMDVLVLSWHSREYCHGCCVEEGREARKELVSDEAEGA